MTLNKFENITIDELREFARTIRKRVLKISSSSKIPHLGSCLSCVDILVYLYWKEMLLDISDPDNSDRDRFLLSKGHAAPALFQVLAERGFFSLDQLNLFGQDGSVFHEHPPKPGYIPGIEAATGSLGHGFSMALGMALASKIKSNNYQVYALLSDGECNEGSIWECAMLATANHAFNLTAIIDYNKWQATGRSNSIMSLDPLVDKWKSFGWHAIEIDGHDFDQIQKSFQVARLNKDAPTVIIANTVKGKGISFMEDDNNWHYRTPNEDELRSALIELENNI